MLLHFIAVQERLGVSEVSHSLFHSFARSNETHATLEIAGRSWELHSKE